MDTQVADALVGSLISGRYRVRSRVARGSTATVYTATDERLDRTVTIKLVHPARPGEPGFLDRFLDETTTLARLTHPNVVAVYDQGSYDGLPYLVTEHVGGRSLREVLATRRRLTSGEALAIMEQMLAALAAGHRAGLVHRDVTPETVQVVEAPSVGRADLVDSVVKVADFGVAQAAEGPADRPVLAAARYVPPELVTDGRADARSDVYSAGIVLYEMLTGRAPFEAAEPAEVAWQHVNRDVPPPSAHVLGLPPAVDDLVAWATNRDPGYRPTDAGALLARVQTVREQVTAVGGRPPPSDSTVVMSAVPTTERPAWARLPVAKTTPAPRRADRPRSGAGPGSGTLVTTGRRQAAGLVDRLLATERHRQAVAAAVVVFGLLVAIGGWWFGIGRWMPAPELVGQPADQAVAQAARLGLTVELTDPAHDLTVPADHVLAQEPTGRIVKGGTVVLTLSLGPEVYPVPDVLGSELDVATRQLESLGFVVAQGEDSYSDTVPEGRVLAISPGVGEEAAAGGTVTVSVSKGRSPLRVPLLLEKTEDQARAELAQLGLGVEVERVDNSRPEGEVVGQSPAYDTGIEAGATVKLEVSNGPPTKPVPNVTNQRCQRAVQEMEQAGFEVSLPTGERGRVLVQNPSPGTGLPPGSEVTLWCV